MWTGQLSGEMVLKPPCCFIAIDTNSICKACRESVCYIEQILAPSLQAGQIAIMDNLSTHTGAKVRQALAAKGCQLLFLPSYSSDFSPIEEAFSKRHPPFYVGWEPKHQTHCRRRLDKHFSRYYRSRCPRLVCSLWLPLRPTFVFQSGRFLEVRKLRGEI